MLEDHVGFSRARGSECRVFIFLENWPRRQEAEWDSREGGIFRKDGEVMVQGSSGMRREAALVTEAVGGRLEQRLGAPQRAAFLWGDAGEASGSSGCGLWLWEVGVKSGRSRSLL